MFLKYRPIQRADLQECVSCVRDRFAYDAAAVQALLEFWQQGLVDGSLQAQLIENQSAPAGQRVYYFNMYC